MLSTDVRVHKPTREAYSRSCNWSIDTSRHVLSRFDTFLLISISDCEHRLGTSIQHGSSAPSTAIHGRRRISIAREVTNSHKQATDIYRLSRLRFAAKHASLSERHERRKGTSALS